MLSEENERLGMTTKSEFHLRCARKEDAKDYRYFPDPDLLPVVIDEEWIREVRNSLPELQPEKMERYQKEYGLSGYDSRIITESRKLSDLFEQNNSPVRPSEKNG